MTDLIRREDVTEALYRVCETDQEEYFSVKQMEAIDSVPAVDAVEVVRCKDCKHRFNRPICACKGDDWFCGYGEREDGQRGGTQCG